MKPKQVCLFVLSEFTGSFCCQVMRVLCICIVMCFECVFRFRYCSNVNKKIISQISTVQTTSLHLTSSWIAPYLSPPARHLWHYFYFGIFDLWSRPWDVARLLGLRGVPPRLHPSEGVGLHHHHPHLYIRIYLTKTNVFDRVKYTSNKMRFFKKF